MTEVGQLAASSICDGRVLPTDCSGLAIVSRFPILEHEFHTYDYRGDIWWLDGEYLARKGVGRVRVEPYRDMIVDVFVTHTAAEDYNRYYREKQVNQLLGLVQRSDADFVILGGDFNVDPRMKESSFLDIEQIMINSIDEFFKKIALWLNPKRATYGNPNNTYSNNYSPVTYDYIFHKANKQNMIWTDFFDVPFLKTFNHLAGKNHTLCTNLSEISLSDHEAVTSHLVLWKYTFQPSNKTDGDSDQA
jgi:endonuclease/exonuclease/phosphatase family metal-dependent hydrolase